MEKVDKLFSATLVVAPSFTIVKAQVDLGADCDCPPVSARPGALHSTLAENCSANNSDQITTNTMFD